MDKGSFTIRAPRRWVTIGLTIILTAVVIAPTAVWAVDRFTDVPDDNVFHDDIAWLADAEVTVGCNPPTNTLFCPSDNVSREQMAAFMRRLAENQVVDAGALEGNAAADLATLAEFAAFDSVTSLEALTTVGSITVEVPVAGTVFVNGASGFVLFGGATVANVGVSASATDLGFSLSVGELDDTAGISRIRLAASPSGAFEVEAGTHTFYLNAERSSVFDTSQVNVTDPTLTVMFVPGA